MIDGRTVCVPQEQVLSVLREKFILNRKIGRHSMEQVDSKTSRVAITGLYSKDTDG